MLSLIAPHPKRKQFPLGDPLRYPLRPLRYPINITEFTPNSQRGKIISFGGIDKGSGFVGRLIHNGKMCPPIGSVFILIQHNYGVKSRLESLRLSLTHWRL